MKIFNRREDEILFDLIARDNPDLTPALSPDNCYIGPAYPNTDTDAAQYNTVATIIPRFGSGLFGRIKIKYNRIDLADLFRGIQPVVVSGNSADQTRATRDEIPAMFGLTYGLPIREGDVDTASSSNFYAKPSASYGHGIFKIANNKCFIGQVPVGFSYDTSSSLATYFGGRLDNVLQLPAGVGTIDDHEDWPLTIGYFADVDFSEVSDAINHDGNLTLDQANRIGAFMGITFVGTKSGPYNPAVDYDQDFPYGCFAVWNTHVARGTTIGLQGQFPWINTKYNYVKILRLTMNPATGGALSKPYYFALHYNRNPRD